MDINQFPILSTWTDKYIKFEDILNSLNSAIINNIIDKDEFVRINEIVDNLFSKLYGENDIIQIYTGNAMFGYPTEIIGLYNVLRLRISADFSVLVKTKAELLKTKNELMNHGKIKDHNSKTLETWFDESKVVGDNNIPLTLYRATTKTTVEETKTPCLGVSFVPNKDLVESSSVSSYVESFHVLIKKPFYMNEAELGELTPESAEELKFKLKRKGYDGVFVTLVKAHSQQTNTILEYIVFDPYYQSWIKLDGDLTKLVEVIDTMIGYVQEITRVRVVMQKIKGFFVMNSPHGYIAL